MVRSEESETIAARSTPSTSSSEVTSPEGDAFGPPPELSDRYRVLGALGRGGVGVVYRGWDEELARPVAIKFLRPDRPGTRRDESLDLASRLRRESMALAALSHPNVVAVYDVVEGTGGVGIVMELVEGVDLRTWLRKEPRSTGEILQVFTQAGRGLEAAHAEGLVHRDFKPGNVMVGQDGRVRVLDFGLARLMAAHPSSPTRHSGRHVVVSRAINTGGFLTEHGTVMGTPAYMAPEQIDGLPLDARSDQFSFCVALYEAFAGKRPFGGASLSIRRRQIDLGPPPLPTISKRLREALEAGLDPDPDRRHPSMRELIAVLEAEQRGSRNPWWMAVVGLATAGAVLGLSSREPEVPGCGAPDPYTTSWGDERRAAIEAAFLGTGAPFSKDAWAKTSAVLDDYVQRWARERDTVCEGEVVEQGRVACLAERRTRFDAVVEIFESADADVVENALAMLRRLPDPDQCEPSRNAELDDPELQEMHARAVALADSGRYEASLAASEELLEKAIVSRNASYEPIGLLLVGSCKDELGDFEGALDVLEDAYFAAIRIGAHQTAVEAALDAAGTAGMDAFRAEEGRKWIRHARTQIERLDDPGTLAAKILVIEGGITLTAGEREEGLALLEEAYEIFVRLGGEDDVEAVNVLNNIGMVYQELGRFDEALAKHERARKVFSEVNGPEHPSVNHAEHAKAGCLAALGRTTEAVETYRRVIARWEKTIGPSHPRVGMAHYNIGHVYQMAEEPNLELALDAYLHAISVLEESTGRNHVNTAMAVHNAGSVYHDMKKLEQAQRMLERSLAVFESAEVNPLYLAINRFELAMVLHERGLDRDRVTQLIETSVGGLANGGAFEQRELEGVKKWIRENRPDLADDAPPE